jgi:hypothetical protein
LNRLEIQNSSFSFQPPLTLVLFYTSYTCSYIHTHTTDSDAPDDPAATTLQDSPHHQAKQRRISMAYQHSPSVSSQTPQLVDEETARLLAHRNTTNLRTISRNDPAVVQILETSVYSVLYQYDEDEGIWIKQKQEGPLFVIRRYVCCME